MEELSRALRAARVSLPICAIGSGSAACGAGVLADLRSSGRVPPSQELRLFSDPSRSAYAVMGAKHGVRATLTATKPANLRGLLAFPWECCCRGRVPFVGAGDPWQQGGVWVLPGDRAAPTYALVEEHPGAPPGDVARMVAAARAVARAQQRR